MIILFLCNKSPWPPREGGPMAMHMFIEGLIARGHEVKVLAINSFKYNVALRDIPVDYARKTSIELIDVDLRVKLPDAFLNLFSGRSYHVQRFISEDFRARLVSLLKEIPFDIVQLETLYMTPYIPVIREYSSARIILRAHNIENRIWERVSEETRPSLKRWYIRRLARTLRDYEETVIAGTDGIVAITENDAGWFLERVREATPVTSIPFGMTIRPLPDPQLPDTYPSLCSIGSMNWIPNQEGIFWFLEKVWPDLHRQFPALHYYIAGREMPPRMTALQLPNVHVVGEVEDAFRFITSHSIMIVPLFSGSGIRIKIIEGMAAGRVVISTNLGAEGISFTPGKNLLTADSPCEFFEMVSICVNNPDLCRKIGSGARELIRAKYDPADLVDRLTAFYYFCRSKNAS